MVFKRPCMTIWSWERDQTSTRTTAALWRPPGYSLKKNASSKWKTWLL